MNPIKPAGELRHDLVHFALDALQFPVQPADGLNRRGLAQFANHLEEDVGRFLEHGDGPGQVGALEQVGRQQHSLANLLDGFGNLVQRFGQRLDRTLDRVTIGIMTASLVIGSAIVMTVHEGPVILGIPVLPAIGFLGYVLAFLNSLWIFYGIWRSGRE